MITTNENQIQAHFDEYWVVRVSGLDGDGKSHSCNVYLSPDHEDDEAEIKKIAKAWARENLNLLGLSFGYVDYIEYEPAEYLWDLRNDAKVIISMPVEVPAEVFVYLQKHQWPVQLPEGVDTIVLMTHQLSHIARSAPNAIIREQIRAATNVVPYVVDMLLIRKQEISHE